jgi:hypothetical protein
LARWLITGGIGIGTVLVVVAAGLVVRSLLRRREINLPVPVIATGALVVALVVVVIFQPQKLFIDDVVDEADPLAAGSEDVIVPTESIAPDEAPSEQTPAEAEPSEQTPVEAEPTVLTMGSFVSRDHPTSGTARVIELGDGGLVLRLEDFATDNGPGLQVYLSTAPTDASHGAFDDDFVHLGPLKGNIGNQNYDIPAGTDLDRYTTVVIWCDPFNVAFGAAALG